MNNIPTKTRTALAFTDIKDGFSKWNIWILLSWQDIRMRYRRSTLGPFWITLSMAITIYTMGLLYGHLFKMELAHYYPYLAASMLGWSLISSLLTDGSGIFIENEHFLKQIKLPYITFILRATARNFIIFFHNIFVIIPIIIFFHVSVNLFTLLFLVGLLVIWINAITFGTILAILGTRFRDITQLINSLIQVVFFLTPVMWSPAILPEKYQYLVKLNPFAQFLELLRNPLLGTPPSAYAFAVTLAITLVGIAGSFFIFARYRARITYWI